jgi:hypothetical protein
MVEPYKITLRKASDPQTMEEIVDHAHRENALRRKNRGMLSDES